MSLISFLTHTNEELTIVQLLLHTFECLNLRLSYSAYKNKSNLAIFTTFKINKLDIDFLRGLLNLQSQIIWDYNYVEDNS